MLLKPKSKAQKNGELQEVKSSKSKKMDKLNETLGRFLKTIEDLEKIELDNALTNLPTDEREDYKATMDAFLNSEELIEIKNFAKRLESV